jgi:hypothetical protein
MGVSVSVFRSGNVISQQFTNINKETMTHDDDNYDKNVTALLLCQDLAAGKYQNC